MTKGLPDTSQSEPTRDGRDLWALVLFLTISLWARAGFWGIPSLSPELAAAMGRPPPPGWINGIFVLYVFSALTLSLTRMAGPPVRFKGFGHVAFLSGFYGFYHVSDALPEHFWAVLVGGAVILSLEAYRCRVQSRSPEQGS